MGSDNARPPGTLGRRFEALLFDWDGTAVTDRGADARAVRLAVETACALGMDLAVVSGTHVGNVDGQLAARPRGPGELHLLLNRGSEVFRVGSEGPELLERRAADEREDAALDRAAAATVERLAAQGLAAEIVSQRLNRRKVDLIPVPDWADPPKARIAELLQAVEAHLREHAVEGLRGAVALAERAASAAQLADARVTSDAKHVEIGLTDKTDSARWYFARLWQRGIFAQQVLIAGDELGELGGLPGSDSKLLIAEADGAAVISVGVEPAGVPDGVLAIGGGPARFLRLLHEQIALRRRGALPIVPSDPCWTLRIDGVDHARERAHEALLTVADGVLGTRGSVLNPRRASRPGAVVAGVYRGRGARSNLQPAPLWNRLALDGSGQGMTRTLDLHAGLLAHQSAHGLQALQFSSLARPGLAILRATGARAELERGAPLVAPARTRPQMLDQGKAMRIAAIDGALEAAAEQVLDGNGERAALQRLAGYVAAAPDGHGPRAAEQVRRARAAGGERLLIEHRCRWAERWEQSDVCIDGDAELQLAVRLALYHLMGSTADGGEAAVGARGLTGRGYRGHVFWDSDVFVLPFLAATRPAAARAILEYRLRRLPAAQAAARAAGRRGARFAWESAASGADVTPRAVRDPSGRRIAVHTGQREEHIVADVAWAAACYIDWTGDRAFRAGPGKRLFVETARYWASRIEREADGSAHIRGVIGPDEYHERVDDNAYTNVMARWNLRRALAESTSAEVEHAERADWAQLAEALVDGYRADSGLYEQFAGFFALEPIVISELIPTRPISAERLLSSARLRRAQVVKQADVLMLHHLVPEEVAPASLAANLAFYEPRTAHGSSLSPGIHAALFARAGRLPEAQAMLRLTARMDLDDPPASTADGVHLAAMGSTWQALAYGFAGARPLGEALALDPRLPQDWNALELRLRFRDAQLRLRVTAEAIELRADQPLRVSLGGAGQMTIDARATRLLRR